MNFIDRIKSNIKASNEKSQIINKWKEIMAQTGTYNKCMDTYTITEVTKETFGYTLQVKSVPGLPLDGLEKLVPHLQSEYNCDIVFEEVDKQTATIRIMYANSIKLNSIPFKPVKVKPYELYLGVDILGRPIIADMNKEPHCLIAGQTGKGKNGGLDHSLISLIEYNDPKDLILFLFAGAKSDLSKYTDCPHVQGYTTDFAEMLDLITWVTEEMDRRIQLVTPMVKNMEGDNLLDFNARYPSKSLPYIYVVVDEFLSLMEFLSKDEKDLKNKIKIGLRKIAQYGRAVGVFYIVCHQKPEKELMPTFLKNMTNVRVCYGFLDEVCSKIVLGNSLAYKLPARRAYALVDGEYKLLFTTDLRQTSKKIILKNRVTYHRTIQTQLKKARDTPKEEPASKRNTGVNIGKHTETKGKINASEYVKNR